jgi:hypothetical protein
MIHTSNRSANQVQFLLILAEPDWSSPVRASARLPVDIREGVTGWSERVADAVIPTWSLDYPVVLKDGDLQQLRAALGGLGDRRVGLAFWPDLNAEQPYLGGLRASWNGAYSDLLLGSITGGRANTVPLVIGYLSDETLQAITDGLSRVRLRLREDGRRYAASPAGTAPAEWTWPFDWATAPEQGVRSLAQTSQIGRSRQSVQDGAPEVRLWTQKTLLTLERPELRSFIAWWAAKGGARDTFSLPSALAPGAPTPTAPHHFGEDGSLPVRFSADTLSIDFTLPDLAQVRVGVEQVVATPAVDQTPPAEAYLFTFTYEGATARLTDWPADIVVGDYTWTPASIEAGRIRQSLRPQNEDCEITVEITAVPLLEPLLRLESETPVQVLIETVDVGPANPTPRTLFTGAIPRARGKGKTARLTCQAFAGALGRKIPRFMYSHTCNHTLFSHGCTRRRPGPMNPEAWKYTGTIHSQWDPSSPRLLVGAWTAPSGKPANPPEHYFAGGWLEIDPGTPHRQVREIRWSNIDNDNRLNLVLARSLREESGTQPFQGKTVVFWPGCDGAYATCGSKFANQVNFGGLPHIPAWIEQAPSRLPRGGK